MSEPWLSADDMSAHLGVTKDTIYLWIADKAMPAHKVGRLWKFLQAANSAYTEEAVTDVRPRPTWGERQFGTSSPSQP